MKLKNTGKRFLTMMLLVAVTFGVTSSHSVSATTDFVDGNVVDFWLGSANSSIVEFGNGKVFGSAANTDASNAEIGAGRANAVNNFQELKFHTQFYGRGDGVKKYTTTGNVTYSNAFILTDNGEVWYTSYNGTNAWQYSLFGDTNANRAFPASVDTDKISTTSLAGANLGSTNHEWVRHEVLTNYSKNISKIVDIEGGDTVLTFLDSENRLLGIGNGTTSNLGNNLFGGNEVGGYGTSLEPNGVKLLAENVQAFNMSFTDRTFYQYQTLWFKTGGVWYATGSNYYGKSLTKNNSSTYLTDADFENEITMSNGQKMIGRRVALDGINADYGTTYTQADIKQIVGLGLSSVILMNDGISYQAGAVVNGNMTATSVRAVKNTVDATDEYKNSVGAGWDFIEEVYPGHSSVFVRMKSGRIWAKGYNGYGNLGFYGPNNRSLLTDISDPSNTGQKTSTDGTYGGKSAKTSLNIMNPKKVMLGENTNMMLRSDGSLVSSGISSYGYWGTGQLELTQFEFSRIKQPYKMVFGPEIAVDGVQNAPYWEITPEIVIGKNKQETFPTFAEYTIYSCGTSTQLSRCTTQVYSNATSGTKYTAANAANLIDDTNLYPIDLKSEALNLKAGTNYKMVVKRYAFIGDNGTTLAPINGGNKQYNSESFDGEYYFEYHQDPVIEVGETRNIPLNGTFVETDGVTGTDGKGDNVNFGNGTNDLKIIENTVNTNVAGVYKVTYEMTDKYRPIVTTKTLVVVVNDGSFVIGTDFIIQANNYEIRKGQVNAVSVADPAILEGASVKVYSNETGDVVADHTSADIKVTKGVPAYEEGATYGKHPVTFEYKLEPGLEISKEVDVIKGEMPTIEGADFISVDKDTEFNPLAGVEGKDKEDVTVAIASVDGTVDINTAGVYVLTYLVIDSDGNEVSVDRVVAVSAINELVVGENYIIQANSFVKRRGQVTEEAVLDATILSDSTTTLYDKKTGAVVTTPTYTVEKSNPIYQVGAEAVAHPIKITPALEPTLSINIFANVTKGEAPVITGATYKEINLGTPFNNKTDVSVSDGEDTDMNIDSASVEITGEVNFNKVGVYTVRYSATDSDFNSTIIDRVVVVKGKGITIGTDYIITANDYTIRKSLVDANAITPATIKRTSELKVYEKNTGREVTAPNVSTTFGDPTYVVRPEVGPYPVKFKYTPENTLEIDITITVEAGNKPIITGDKLTQIDVNTPFDPKSGMNISDNEDTTMGINSAEPTVKIVSNVDITTSGVYTVKYTAKDSDDNVVVFDRVVVVKGDNIVVGDKYIITANDYRLRPSEAKLDVEFLNETMTTKAGVVIYNKEDGSVSTTATATAIAPTFVKNVGLGDYAATYQVDQETTLTIDRKITVWTGVFPIIEADTFTSFVVGNEYKPFDGVVAHDEEDGPIDTSEIVKLGEVNPDVPGVYKIAYQVTDSDGNTTTLDRRVVAVAKSGELVIGDKYIIQVLGYNIRVGQVDATAVSDATIKNSLNVRVYDKETGDVIPGAATTLTKGTGAEEYKVGVNAGEYPLSISVDLEPTLTVDSKVTVLAGEKPEIHGANLVQLTVGSAFDSRAGVTVTDDFDTLTAADITITGTLTTDTVGVYPLTYTVKDSDRNTTTITRVVVVSKDGESVVGDKYILLAQPYEIRVGSVSGSAVSDNIIKNSAQVRVYNKTTGVYLPGEPVKVEKGTGAEEYKVGVPIGTYPLTYKVTAEPTTTITSSVKVVTGKSPTITGADYIEVDLNSEFNARAGVVGYDEEDKFITGSIVVSGRGSTAEAGVYKVNYTLFDSDGNKTVVNRVVVVKDPETVGIGDKYIIKAHSYQLMVSDVTAQAVLDSTIRNTSGFTVYDKLTGNVVPNPKIVITRGEGAQEYAVGVPEGDYPITYSLENDNASLQITVHVNAGVPPVIHGADFLEIGKNETFNPLEGISITDEETPEGIPLTDPTFKVEGTVDTAIPGVYKVVYYVEDRDGNDCTVTRVVVVSNPGETVVGNEYIITAQAYEIRKGQVTEVTTTDENIFTSTVATIYSKETGDIVENPQLVLTKGAGDQEYKVGVGLGDYPLTLSTTLEAGLNLETKVTVISGESPVFTGPIFIEVVKGSDFDLYTEGAITDEEDVIIPNTNAVITGDEVDFETPGIYKVIYTVEDSDGNPAEAFRIIAVTSPGEVVAGENYVIAAKDYEIRKGQVDANAVSDATILTSGEVVVYDKLTGDVNTTVTKTVTKGTGADEYKVGAVLKDYPLTYSIEEEPTLQIQNKVTVVSGLSPEINGLTYLEVNVGAGIDLNEGVSVTDDHDTDLTFTTNPTTISTATPGVHKVVYTTVDSDGNTVSKNRVVVVKDDTITVGTRYIITAKDYTLRRGQVTGTAIQAQNIKNSATAAVYDKTTGNLVVDPVIEVVKDAGYIINAPAGNYPMTYKYNVEPGLQITKKAIVITGNAPTINNVNSTSVAKGTGFDPKAGVTVTDDFDTLTAANVNVTGTVDINVPGIYKLTYKVKDSDLNETTVQRVVVVTNPGEIVAGTNYIIKANDYEIRKGLVTDITVGNETIITSANVKVYSMETGLEITNPNITVAKGTGADEYKVGVDLGDYPLTYSVVEEPTLTITNKVSVIDGRHPEFKGPLFVEVSKGDATFNLYKATENTDFEDGNLTADKVEITAGTFDVNVTGVYSVGYKLTDSDGNVTNVTRVIAVSSPDELVVGTNYIIEANDYSIYKGKVVDATTTSEAIFTAAGVKVYSLDPAKLGEDVTATAKITVQKLAPQYLPGVNEGTYDVIFSIESEPALKIENTITVLKGESPEIKGADFVEVTKGSTFDAKAGVTAKDTEDTTLSVNDVGVTGNLNTEVSGVYKLTYTVTDSDRNTTLVTRVVVVSAPGELVVGDNFIISAKDYTIRKGQVKGTELLDSTIIVKSRVELFSKPSGDPVVANVASVSVTKNTPEYVETPAVGLYPITFGVKAEPGLTVSNKINVVAGEGPKINGATFAEVTKGTTFDPRKDVNVTDDFDTINVASVKIEGTVNEAIPGVYKLVYTVTDSDGNPARVERVVAVSEPGKLVVGDTHIIQGTSYDIRKGLVNDLAVSDTTIKSSAGIKIYDKATGNEVVAPQITLTKKDPVYQVGAGLGAHPIEVTSDIDTTLKLNINVNVISGESPKINGATFKEVTKGTAVDLKAGITVSDDFDRLTVDNVTIAPTTIDTSVVGIHEVTYTVTDSDGNKTTVKRMVVVSDSSELVVGSKYIIKATGYEIRKGNVDATAVDSPAIITTSGAKLFNKADGSEVATPQFTVTKGNPEYKVGVGIGDYPVTFSTELEPALKLTAKVTVVNGKAPVIEIEKFTQLAVGVDFNPNEGLRASDFEDTALSAADVEVTSNVDTSKVGVYKVTYTVTDNDFNTTEVVRVVVVGDDTDVAVGDRIIIVANDYEIRKALKNEDSVKIETVVASANTVVYDKETGNVIETPLLTVNYVDPNYYSAKEVGKYPVIIESIEDPTAKFTIEVTIFAGEGPVIENAGFVEVVAGGTFDPLAGITITDDFDRLTANDLVVTNNVDTNKPGVYKVQYSITDTDGNTTNLTRVVAVTKPGSVVVGDTHIIQANEYTIRKGQVDAVEAQDATILANANVKVYEKATGNEVDSSSVKVNRSTPEYAQGVPVGRYDMNYEYVSTTDARAINKVSIDSYIDVIKANAPVISGSSFVEIDVNSKYNPLTDIDVSDVEDTNISISSIKVESNVNTEVPGVYQVKYTITDSDDNTTVFDRVVLVHDGRTVVVKNEFVILANSFIIDIKDLTEANLTDKNILASANAQVYNKATGEVLDPNDIIIKGISPALTVNSGVGAYEVTYVYSKDPSVTITKIINIVNNKASVNNVNGINKGKVEVVTTDGSAIIAENIKINVSEVSNLNSENIAKLANLKTWNVETGEKIKYEIDYSRVLSAPGIYDVYITTPDGNMLVIQVTVEGTNQISVPLPKTGSDISMILFTVILSMSMMTYYKVYTKED